MPITTERSSGVPLFDLFSVEQLTALTPYSTAYLRDLKGRPNRIRPQFRRMVARCLGKPESELFGGESHSTVNRQGVDDSRQEVAEGQSGGEQSNEAATCR